MRDAASNALDRAERLAEGRAMLEAYLYGEGDLDSGEAGAAIDYSHRLNKGLAAFARGEVGYSYGSSHGLGWRALAGLRGRF